jgi:tetratricopeptide (TPR) repeat protein
MTLHRAAAAVAGLAALLLSAAIPGCVSRGLVYSPEALEAQYLQRTRGLAAAALVVPYRVSPEDVDRARRAGISGSRYQRTLALVDHMVSTEGLGLEYRPVVTRSAEETLRSGYGNCLSLSSAFVGLARALGLSAHYVRATQRIDSSERVGDFLVSSGHVAAVVHTEEGDTAVDFDRVLDHYRRFDRIGDLEALAHFYNNRGYEIIYQAQEAGEPIPWEDAGRHFETAIRMHPDLAGAWSNAGIAQARLGRTEEAARRYREAMARDPGFAAPRNNLGKLYLDLGEPAAAARACAEAVRLAPRNPYARFNLGRALYESGDLEAAVEVLEAAAALAPDYAAPARLLERIARERGGGSPPAGTGGR